MSMLGSKRSGLGGFGGLPALAFLAPEVAILARSARLVSGEVLVWKQLCCAKVIPQGRAQNRRGDDIHG